MATDPQTSGLFLSVASVSRGPAPEHAGWEVRVSQCQLGGEESNPDPKGATVPPFFPLQKPAKRTCMVGRPINHRSVEPLGIFF